MKRLVMAALAALVLMPVPSALAEVPNVGVVDMLKVSEGYERYSQARRALEQKKAELQTIVDEEEQTVLALIEELEAVRATATQDEITRRRNEIEARDRELRDFVGQTNMQFRDELDTLQFRTKDEVESVVVSLAQRLGLSLVLERNMTLYTAPALEITDKVIAELNLRYRPLPPPQMNIMGRRPSAAASTPPTAFPATSPGTQPGNPGRGWPFER